MDALIYALIVLLVVGAILYVVSLLPLDATIKRIINVVAILIVGIWVIVYLLLPMLHHANPGLR